MRTWQEFMVDRIKNVETGVPWYLHDKLKCYRFCEENGIATATVVREFETPDQIDLTGIEGEFVLKPTLQSSMKGVMVLNAKGEGYYDSLRRRDLTVEEIVAEQTKMFEETKAAGKKIIIERKIEDADGFDIPRDFKAYSFRGEVELILEINRNTKPSSVSWFDGNFEPLTDDRVTSNPEFVNEVPAVRPAAAQQLLELARKASAIVPSPFASVDMYNTVDGPMVGEITLAPGGLYHGKHFTLSSAQQRIMGLMWERAEQDIRDSQETLPSTDAAVATPAIRIDDDTTKLAYVGPTKLAFGAFLANLESSAAAYAVEAKALRDLWLAGEGLGDEALMLCASLGVTVSQD